MDRDFWRWLGKKTISIIVLVFHNLISCVRVSLSSALTKGTRYVSSSLSHHSGQINTSTKLVHDIPLHQVNSRIGTRRNVSRAPARAATLAYAPLINSGSLATGYDYTLRLAPFSLIADKCKVL